MEDEYGEYDDIFNTIEGKDTLVVQPKSSGKSLCFFSTCLSKQEGYHCDSNHKLNARSGA